MALAIKCVHNLPPHLSYVSTLPDIKTAKLCCLPLNSVSGSEKSPLCVRITVGVWRFFAFTHARDRVCHWWLCRWCPEEYGANCQCFSSSMSRFLWTPAQRSLSEVHYILPVFLKIFFYGQRQSKQQKWPLVYKSSHVYTQSPPNTQSRANAATLKNLHHMCLGSGHSPSPVGRSDSMCLHRRPCVWLPFAAVCFYTLFYLLMMPAARLVCQRPSSNFPYFRTPLANFLLSRPNSVEYGNSKTTTLLHSAKCTGRTGPLFQGRTGCGGRPSGWHDIVTCQRLVFLCNV